MLLVMLAASQAPLQMIDFCVMNMYMKKELYIFYFYNMKLA